MVKNKLLSVSPLMAPPVLLILALVSVNTHAKDVLLEPSDLFNLACHWGHCGTTTTSPCITHEGLRGSGRVMGLLSFVVDFLGLEITGTGTMREGLSSLGTTCEKHERDTMEISTHTSPGEIVEIVEK